MTPLMLKIMCGEADGRLLDIISDLEAIRDNGFGISPMESATLNLAYNRLEQITRP